MTILSSILIFIAGFYIGCLVLGILTMNRDEEERMEAFRNEHQRYRDSNQR